MPKNPLFLSLLALVCLTENIDAAPSKPSPSQTPASKPPSSSETFKPFTGKVSGSKVRLRNQPDLDGKVLRELNKGDLLIVVGESNGYYAVQPPKGTKVYVFRSYVLDGVVEGSRVNARLEPNLEAPIIAQLNAGDKVQGTISPSNNKWLEIDAPASARFYVAKDYVQSIGSPDVFDKIQKRKSSVEELLNNAYATSQRELRKPFDQINLDQIYQQFNRIIKDFQDFPDQVAKAKEALDLVQKTYLQKQIAFLESKTQQTEQSIQNKQAAINAEIEGYQKKLADLESQLKKERETAYQMVAGDTSPDKKNPAPSSLPPSTAAENKDTPVFQTGHWASIENDLYHQWLRKNPPGSMNDFYKAQLVKSVSLQGTLEPFSQSIQNRPGDYVLKVNGLPVAYLYSTRVNLQEYVGQSVKITGFLRPNNRFAYPAYFVNSIEPMIGS